MKTLKIRHVAIIIAAIIIVDQALKIWIKINHPTGEVIRVGGMDWFRLHFIEHPGWPGVGNLVMRRVR
jgi:signal peptidase II